MKTERSTPYSRTRSLKGIRGTLNESLEIETHFKENLIGDIIKRARERQQITQGKLAQRLGINKSNISKIENNLTSIRMETFFKIMHALGISSSLHLRFKVNAETERTN